MATPDKPTLVLISTEVFRVRVVGTSAGDEPTSWDVRYRTNDGTNTGTYISDTGVDGGASLDYTISGLAAGTRYEIDVRATNSDGTSTYSTAVYATTLEVDTVGILQSDLTNIQMGLEAAASPGTLVAATRNMPYLSASYQPTVERENLEEKGTVLADTTDIVTKRGSMMERTEPLNTETLLIALLCSVARVSPVALSGAQRWTFTPSVTAPTAIGTATVEIAATDGTDHYRGRFGFARCTALSVEAGGDTAQLSTTWMGRRKQTLTSPANVDAPSRWIIPSALFSLYIDDSWANLGDTHYGMVRSLSFTLDPGVAEVDAVAGRSDLDVAYWLRGRIRGGLTVVVDHDSDASDELTHWEDGDLRFMRLEATNGETGANLRRLRIDTCSRYIDTPDVIASDEAQHTLSLASQLRADSSDNILSIEVVNGLSSW